MDERRFKSTGTAVVLQGGHAACILVERVEKPTDNRPARLFLLPRGRCRFSRSDRPGVGPGAFPHTPPCAWARGYFDGSTRSRAEGGTGRRNKTPIPGGHHEGDRGRVRMSSPRRTARGSHTARPIGHSVGRKVAINWNIAGVSQSGHWGCEGAANFEQSVAIRRVHEFLDRPTQAKMRTVLWSGARSPRPWF